MRAAVLTKWSVELELCLGQGGGHLSLEGVVHVHLQVAQSVMLRFQKLEQERPFPLQSGL